MKTYDRSGTKTITRASAMALIVIAATAGAPIPAECSEHPNYHVRRAAWLADGSPIPETVEGKVVLLKSVQPNLFDRASKFKGNDNNKVAHRAGEINKVTEHNAKAELLFAAEPEKFELLVAWLPIYQRDLRKFGENPESSQAEYNARAVVLAEVDAWIRERCQQYVPEPIVPVAFDSYAALLCDDNSVGAVLLSADVAEALAAS
jgi:hypothetical protein